MVVDGGEAPYPVAHGIIYLDQELLRHHLLWFGQKLVAEEVLKAAHALPAGFPSA